jgi:hypothetical protein
MRAHGEGMDPLASRPLDTQGHVQGTGIFVQRLHVQRLYVYIA